MLLNGDNINLLKQLESNSVDSVVTDPPYGLSFMGKKWDYDVPSVDFWIEVLRVLKPGGHVLSFGGTRTYHRMVVNIEDAGFEIRDQIMWLYGSGFPKSHNLGKKIKKWDGWGTALKPANEPIVLARKPLSEKTVVDNVLKYGTGVLNIDGCRIGTEEKLSSGRHITGDQKGPSGYKTTNRSEYKQNSKGRWPANVLLDEDAAQVLDEQSGNSISRPHKNKTTGKSGIFNSSNNEAFSQYNDSGGASRFFYIAKASKRERNAGLDDEQKTNHHPTLKPIKLMQYLIKLITPPNGVVLDPFMGSGSTGIACKNLGFNFIGMELDKEYYKIAEKRIEGANGHFKSE